MQHHVTGKWDRQVAIVRKRKKGDSYLVKADNGKTYIRGRRLLKEINTNNVIQQKGPEPPTDPSPKMPRRSSRLQNKKKEKVEVITVRRTKIEYGGQNIKAKASSNGGSRPQGGSGQSQHHQHINEIPHLGITRADSKHHADPGSATPPPSYNNVEGRGVEKDEGQEEARADLQRCGPRHGNGDGHGTRQVEAMDTTGGGKEAPNDTKRKPTVPQPTGVERSSQNGASNYLGSGKADGRGGCTPQRIRPADRNPRSREPSPWRPQARETVQGHVAGRRGRGGHLGRTNITTSRPLAQQIEVIDLTGDTDEEDREEKNWMVGDDIQIINREYKNNTPVVPKFRWNCDRDIEIFAHVDSEESDWDKDLKETEDWDTPRPRKKHGRKTGKIITR